MPLARLLSIILCMCSLIVQATPIPAVRDEISAVASSISSSVFGDDDASRTSTKPSATASRASAATSGTKALALDTTEDGGLNTTFSVLYFALVVILIFCAIVILTLGLCLGRRVQEVKKLKAQLAQQGEEKETLTKVEDLETIAAMPRSSSPVPSNMSSWVDLGPPALARTLSISSKSTMTVVR